MDLTGLLCASAACAQLLLLGLPVTSSSSDCKVAPCDPIALACRTLYMAPIKEGRLLAEDGSGRLFRVIVGVASAVRKNTHFADFGVCVWVNLNQESHDLSLPKILPIKFSHAGSATLLLGSRNAVDFKKVDRSQSAGHGCVLPVEALASDAHTVTRGGHPAKGWGGQFTSRNPWRTVRVVA